MGNTAHKIQIGVQNVSDENTAVAIATDWLRDELSEIDVAQADATVGTGETTVDFMVRITPEQVETIINETNFTYIGAFN